MKLTEAFRRFGPAYLNEFKDAMPSGHRQALESILACHTDALGGSVHRCRDCDYERYVYHSCRNRACPKCQNGKTDAWAEGLRESLLPVAHFHVVFTLPQELRRLVRSHQRVANAALMKAAFAALEKLSKGRIGAVAVLHTWSRSLIYHPHAHLMVPAGFVSEDGNSWTASNPAFIVPVKPLKSVFRAVFARMLRRQLPGVSIPQEVWKKDWNVRTIPFHGNVDRLVDYLARYVHRVAISENRIIDVGDERVVFKGGNGPVNLAGKEFIRRFVQHAPPKGFHKVRRFGIMHPANAGLRNRIRLVLPKKPERRREIKPAPPSFLCPHCGCIIAIVRPLRAATIDSRAPP